MMKTVLRYKRIWLLGLVPISYALILAAKHNSYFAEQIYALHIYKWISQIISTVSGVFPFSLAEILILVLPVVAVTIFIWFIVRLARDKEKRRERLFKGVLSLLCAGSVVLFLFTILAGINYYRYSFSYYSDLEVRDSTVDELYMLTENLTVEANYLRTQVPKTDDNGVFQLSMNQNELSELVGQAFNLLSKDYPVLGGYYGSPKPILLSSLMSKTEITGIYIPFTMEANVNIDIPDYTIPVTMFHEMAHLRGFMREDEANYIAYLAGMQSGDVELQYSSTMLALVISGNALYAQDKDLYFQIRDQYSKDILIDIRANSAYWQQYEDTVISTVSNKINDTYLKANDQEDGVKSYGRMVDLLLALSRKDNEIKE